MFGPANIVVACFEILGARKWVDSECCAWTLSPSSQWLHWHTLQYIHWLQQHRVECICCFFFNFCVHIYIYIYILDIHMCHST